MRKSTTGTKMKLYYANSHCMIAVENYVDIRQCTNGIRNDINDIKPRITDIESAQQSHTQQLLNSEIKLSHCSSF